MANQKRRLDSGQIEIVDDAVAEILRLKTPAERIALAAAAHRTARELLTARVRSLFPKMTADQVRNEVVRKFTRG